VADEAIDSLAPADIRCAFHGIVEPPVWGLQNKTSRVFDPRSW
jgi:hypothetical protein